MTMILSVIITAIILFANRKKRNDELTAFQQFNPVVPVVVVSPVRQAVSPVYTENGMLQPGSEVTILSETSGKALTVYGNIGDRVHRGQTLVTVEKEVSESLFRLAKMNLENAEKDLARYNNLAGGEAVTPQQLEAARLKYQDALTQFTVVEKQLENTTIRATVSGVISKRMIEKGSFLIPSLPLFTLSEQEQLIFLAHVAEQEVMKLHSGQETHISIDAFPGEVFTGYVRGISKTPDLAGRYATEVLLPNPDGRLLAGMSGRGSFMDETDEEALVIPRKCIAGSIREGKIFIVSGDSVIQRRVNALTLNENEVIVTEGISETDRIVVSGQINLEEGSKVRMIHANNVQ